MIEIKEISSISEAKKELKKLEVYKEGIGIMAPKFLFKVFKLKNLDIRAALILKQEMLSIGGEAAIPRGAIDLSLKVGNVLLAGTVKQYKALIKKLKRQPFGLKEVSAELEKLIGSTAFRPEPIKCGEYELNFDRPLIMGVLNVTPDSFSDGGDFVETDTALDHAVKMAEDGADIIDVGGESTRPGSDPVPLEDELRRVEPVVRGIVENCDLPVSVDTAKPAVAERCINLGASMLNDVTGLRNSEMIRVAAEYEVPVVIMHMKGKPKTMQKEIVYGDVVSDIKDFFMERIEEARSKGVKDIIIDPGIGFGKTTEHNLTIIKRLEEFRTLQCPVLIGTSRKSFIGNTLGIEDSKERLYGTIASNIAAAENGADIIRVHDVEEHKEALDLYYAIKKVEKC
ncbi:MAG: dihydropteroate synthase [Euryarchaeota archaeon]|nr:dihydropteroate synthase [Euryarchaeota archaeon]